MTNGATGIDTKGGVADSMSMSGSCSRTTVVAQASYERLVVRHRLVASGRLRGGGTAIAPRRVLRAFALSVLSCALLVVLLLPSPALADNGEVGATGGSVYPIWTTDIRMTAETVQATCFGSFAEYRIDFEFFNESKARWVRLGFP